MGDVLYFEVNQNGTEYYDTTAWDPVIEYKEIPIYQASTDFSSTQGYQNWYYVEKTTSGYLNMSWNAAGGYWNGVNSWCRVAKEWQHPQANDSVRKWVAPYSGTIIVSSNGNVRKIDASSGDGVKVRFLKNSALLWEEVISGTDNVGVCFPERVVEVNVGDVLYFEVNQNGTEYYDITAWDPVIEYYKFTFTNAIAVDCYENKEVNLALSGNNISSNSKTFTIQYMPDDLDVIDLCKKTSTCELTTGNIISANIEIIKFDPKIGQIIFVYKGLNANGTSWSGQMNIVEFRSKKVSGTTVIYYW